MSDDLKPCPFCGEAQPPHDDTSWVRCLGCGAETGWRPTGDEAIAAWNTRAPDPSIEDLTDQLEAARADTKKAVEALRAVDALDPEGRIDGCSQSALRGLVLRMGEISRITLAEIEGKKE